MKYNFFISCALIIFLISCTEKKTQEEPSMEISRIINKEVDITYDNCLPDSMSCTFVKIDYPQFTDSASQNLNQIIDKKLRITASSYFREETIDGNFEYMANLFIQDYNGFRVDFPDYNIGWYVQIFSEITYESDRILSFRIDAEAFTGGAHPNSSSNYFVIDKSTNKELTTADIFSDTSKFKQLLEAAFRKEKGIDAWQSFADQGFYLEDGDFLLNNNIGITDQSVIVYFNPYEIAPYSLGATTLELKKSTLEGLLKIN